MFINTQTNQYPITEWELRSLFPNTSFPAPFQPPEGYAWVFPVPVPSYNSVIQMAREIAPVFTNKGVWEQRWEVVSKFVEYTDEDNVVHTVEEQEQAAIAQDTLKNQEALKHSIIQATQNHLDTFARTRNYDDIKSASDYAGCSVQKYNIEGTYCRNVRAETWQGLYEILEEVLNNTRPVPTGFSDIVNDLPPLVWPN